MEGRDFEQAWYDYVFCSDQKKKEAALQRLVELATTINQWLRILELTNAGNDIKKKAEEKLRKLFSQRKISPAFLA